MRPGDSSSIQVPSEKPDDAYRDSMIHLHAAEDSDAPAHAVAVCAAFMHCFTLSLNITQVYKGCYKDIFLAHQQKVYDGVREPTVMVWRTQG